MGSFFCDATIFQDNDFVCVADGGEAVCNDEGGAALVDNFEGFSDSVFGFCVQGSGGFVQDEDGGIQKEDACQSDALLLAFGEPGTLFADAGVVAFWEGGDEVVDAGGMGGVLYVL